MPDSSTQGSATTWPGHARTLLLHAAFAVAIAATVTALTVRDRFAGASALYYAFPLPAALLAFVVLGCVWWKLGNRRLAKVDWAFALALGCWLGWCAWQPRDAHALAKHDVSIRVMVWDVGACRLGPERIVNAIAEHTPDIAVILDPGPSAADSALWGRTLPSHSLIPLGEAERLSLLVRGSPSRPRVIEVEGSTSFVAICRIEVADTEIDLVVADLTADATESREPAFELIERTIADGKRPVILAGGFRTPRGSKGFDRLRERTNNTYEMAGGGSSASFPMPLPLWELDHIWVDKSWAVAEWSSPWTTCSFSRPVLAVVSRRE